MLRVSGLFAIVACLLLIAAPADAGKNKKNNNNNQAYKKQIEQEIKKKKEQQKKLVEKAKPYIAERDRLKKSRDAKLKSLEQARTALTRAQAEANAVEARLRQEAVSDPAFIDLRKQEAAAAKEVRDRREIRMSEIRRLPEYQKLTAAVQAAQKRLDAVGPRDQKARIKAHQQMLDAQQGRNQFVEKQLEQDKELTYLQQTHEAIARQFHDTRAMLEQNIKHDSELSRRAQEVTRAAQDVSAGTKDYGDAQRALRAAQAKVDRGQKAWERIQYQINVLEQKKKKYD